MIGSHYGKGFPTLGGTRPLRMGNPVVLLLARSSHEGAGGVVDQMYGHACLTLYLVLTIVQHELLDVLILDATHRTFACLFELVQATIVLRLFGLQRVRDFLSRFFDGFLGLFAEAFDLVESI